MQPLTPGDAQLFKGLQRGWYGAALHIGMRQNDKHVIMTTRGHRERYEAIETLGKVVSEKKLALGSCFYCRDAVIFFCREVGAHGPVVSVFQHYPDISLWPLNVMPAPAPAPPRASASADAPLEATQAAAATAPEASEGLLHDRTHYELEGPTEPGQEQDAGSEP